MAGGDPCGVATMGHMVGGASALFVVWPAERSFAALEQSAACKPVQSVIWEVAVGAAEIPAEFVTSVPTAVPHYASGL